jgi:hypothetical protein
MSETNKYSRWWGILYSSAGTAVWLFSLSPELKYNKIAAADAFFVKPCYWQY